MNKQEHLIESHLINKKNILEKLQTPCVLWFTGLSGSGKSTLAQALQNECYKHNKATYILDGDNIRKGLNKDLGFSDKDREENIRRISEVSYLLIRSGLIVINAFWHEFPP